MYGFVKYGRLWGSSGIVGAWMAIDPNGIRDSVFFSSGGSYRFLSSDGAEGGGGTYATRGNILDIVEYRSKFHCLQNFIVSEPLDGGAGTRGTYSINDTVFEIVFPTLTRTYERFAGAVPPQLSEE
ncbi:MAG: hypothetical protein PSX36_10255 [bacterium]|nr:hypothetical protein [bacterium]